MHRLHLAIGIVSACLIAFQLVLMQIFAIMHWYHFAFMVISVALLGFGASGTMLSLARERALRNADSLISGAVSLCGITMPASVWLVQQSHFRFDSYLIFIDASNAVGLVLTYLMLGIPFFFGASAIALALMKRTGETGTLYAANLVGSGLGGVIALALLWLLPPDVIPALLGLCASGSGILLIKVRHALLPALCVALAGVFLILPPSVVPSEYKPLSRTLHLPEATILARKPSPYGLLEVVSAPALRYAPGLSLAFTGTIPDQPAVFSNADWFGSIPRWSGQDSTSILDFTTLAFPFVLDKRESVLILGARTGAEVPLALVHGARSVVAVEPHRTAVDLLKRDLAPLCDSLFSDRRVRIEDREPRTFLMMDTSHVDLILLPMIDAFGGTSGLYAMQEQYGFTKEAFAQMWDHLTPDGVISVSSWMDQPSRNPLKALATLAEMLTDRGIQEPEKHIAAVRSWGAITFVAKHSRITEREIKATRTFCREKFFDPALLPSLQPGEREQYNALGDTLIFRICDRLLSGDRASVYEEYDFIIRPATDDRPYFSRFLRWGRLAHLRQVMSDRSLPYLELGSLIAGATFVQILLLATVLILLPLRLLGAGSIPRRRTFLYFALLGVGYMCVEMVLIQRMVLYLGQPLLAASAVISCLLISSGAGSLFSTRLRATPTATRTLAITVAAVLAAYALVLTPLLRGSIAMPEALKILSSLLLIGVPACAMGMLFPLGLRLLHLQSPAQIPWAWGVNGCTSVVSTALAMIVAVEAGFTAVMFSAAVCYTLVAAFGLRASPQKSDKG